MRCAKHNIRINVVRCEALFASPSQPSHHPDDRQIQEAIAQAVGTFGSRGCAERVAQEFGDHPETAVVRMRWSRQLIMERFGISRPHPAHARLLLHPLSSLT
jgi:hypothetical protein